MCSSFVTSCGSYIVPENLPRSALENCIDRIQSLIEQAQSLILSRETNKLSCPIGLIPLEDPVVTNCGHIFNRLAIERWKSKNQKCPVCNGSVAFTTRLHGLAGLTKRSLSKVPVIDCKRSDPSLAQGCFELGNKFLSQHEYLDALTIYRQGLKYTTTSELYSAIPKVYDLWEKKEEAFLSRLYLSLYQLEEGKNEQAIETLKSCNEELLNISSLITSLELLSNHSSENLKTAAGKAAVQENPEERRFIYSQILVYAPEWLDLHQKLIDLTQCAKEKRALLLRAAKIAASVGQANLATQFAIRAKPPVLPEHISEAQWAHVEKIKLPPYSEELNTFLEEQCQIWPEKKRKEMHLVVPLFPKVVIDGNTVPFSLFALNQLQINCGGPSCLTVSGHAPPISVRARKEFCYGVMTIDVLKKSKNQAYVDQVSLLPLGYRPPDILDVVTAIFWAGRYLKKAYLSGHPVTYTRCRESFSDQHYVVGNFGPAGLEIKSDCMNPDQLGMVGWREFSL